MMTEVQIREQSRHSAHTGHGGGDEGWGEVASSAPLLTLHDEMGAQLVALFGRNPAERHTPQELSPEPKLETHWRVRSQPPLFVRHWMGRRGGARAVRGARRCPEGRGGLEHGARNPHERDWRKRGGIRIAPGRPTCTTDRRQQIPQGMGRTGTPLPAPPAPGWGGSTPVEGKDPGETKAVESGQSNHCRGALPSTGGEEGAGTGVCSKRHTERYGPL